MMIASEGGKVTTMAWKARRCLGTKDAKAIAKEASEERVM